MLTSFMIFLLSFAIGFTFFRWQKSQAEALKTQTIVRTLPLEMESTQRFHKHNKTLPASDKEIKNILQSEFGEGFNKDTFTD